jgi:tagatose-6-phosphate ketose/aldose isomerase
MPATTTHCSSLRTTTKNGTAAAPGDWLRIPGVSDARDFELVLPFALIAQLFAFHSSLRLRLRPDTPSTSGRVHRVVKGVTIYPL